MELKVDEDSKVFMAFSLVFVILVALSTQRLGNNSLYCSLFFVSSIRGSAKVCRFINLFGDGCSLATVRGDSGKR